MKPINLNNRIIGTFLAMVQICSTRFWAGSLLVKKDLSELNEFWNLYNVE